MLSTVIPSALSYNLKFAKYARWACDISCKSFEAVLGAIDIFGMEFLNSRSKTGEFPPVEYVNFHIRLSRALEELAIFRAVLKAPNYLELRVLPGENTLSDEAGSAYTDEYRHHLKKMVTALSGRPI